MILIYRGPEPIALSSVRARELPRLRMLGRPPRPDDIGEYRVIAEDIWKAQHSKCCYCEERIPKSFNDVEHYRPKCSANRLPGHTCTHGYWWLAFTWSNLLFSCPSCNRSSKNDQFPLENGSGLLNAEECDVSLESPLLIDPASTVNPVVHIEFVLENWGVNANVQHWYARPREQSKLGKYTIDVCKLNKNELLELRDHHVNCVVMPQVNAIREALRRGDHTEIQREFVRAKGLLKRSNTNVALSFDVLRYFIHDRNLLSTIGQRWPAPYEVGVTP